MASRSSVCTIAALPRQHNLLDAQGKGVLKMAVEILLSWFEDFYPQWGSEQEFVPHD
jgi:hypothetical protein